MREPTVATDGRAVLGLVSRRLLTRIPVANFIGALLAIASGALTGRIRHEPGFGWIDVVTFVIYMSLVSPIFFWWDKRCLTRALGWLSDDRKPTPLEQRRTLGQPWIQAVSGMAGWVGAALIWSIITIVGHSAGYTVRVAVSILLGGLTTCGLIYLLTEWTMRPVAALALAGEVPERRLVPGIRLKLLLAWAVGSDVFLVMIALTYVGRPKDQPPSEAAVWFIVGAGLVAGTAVFAVATKSLIVPLLDLRRNVAKVQGGDLDVHVDVYDGGEIGLLQAGFNQMVAGLRERRTLEDLFGRHVGTDVARQALDQGVDLVGSRVDAGVIFVDVIGSTGLSLRTAPEEMLGLLNRFFSTVVRVVEAEGGWVNKFEGDGALCIFGAPVAQPDYALRALRAARTLRSELLTLTAVYPDLDAAVGVSAGTVVAGNVGAEQRYEYTVIGHAVNEAARLTDEAKGRLGRVLAGEEAITRAGNEARNWAVADELVLRGTTEPTLVYEPKSWKRESTPPTDAEAEGRSGRARHGNGRVRPS